MKVFPLIKIQHIYSLEYITLVFEHLFVIKEVISMYQKTGNIEKLKLFIITAEKIMVYSLSVIYVHLLTNI